MLTLDVFTSSVFCNRDKLSRPLKKKEKKLGVWGHPPPQDFFAFFTNKRSILVHSDKMVKAKKEHLLTKTNGARELSFKLIFCLVEISNIKSADT